MYWNNEWTNAYFSTSSNLFFSRREVKPYFFLCVSERCKFWICLNNFESAYKISKLPPLVAIFLLAAQVPLKQFSYPLTFNQNIVVKHLKKVGVRNIWIGKSVWCFPDRFRVFRVTRNIIWITKKWNNIWTSAFSLKCIG